MTKQYRVVGATPCPTKSAGYLIPLYSEVRSSFIFELGKRQYVSNINDDMIRFGGNAYLSTREVEYCESTTLEYDAIPYRVFYIQKGELNRFCFWKTIPPTVGRRLKSKPCSNEYNFFLINTADADTTKWLKALFGIINTYLERRFANDFNRRFKSEHLQETLDLLINIAITENQLMQSHILQFIINSNITESLTKSLPYIDWKELAHQKLVSILNNHCNPSPTPQPSQHQWVNQ